MASSNNDELISKASPHTIKKFELVEAYITDWSQKLMNTQTCNGLIFIDCMCNSGLYYDENGEIVKGTPIRVANVLRSVAGQYPHKQVFIYFNDYNPAKIDLLNENLPEEKGNFHIVTSKEDGNALLKDIGSKLDPENHLHYFLLYDPYDASIDWEALAPFFRYWGEVMINHMVSDPVRAITQVKKNDTKKKYEATYLTDFGELVPFGSDKDAYQKRVEHIIDVLKGKRRYYVSAFPFYNTQNSQMYNLIHCTSNPVGFQLYKTKAWKTFNGRSSTKKVKETGQLELDMFLGGVKTHTDENCYDVDDIVYYMQKTFSGKKMFVDDIWAALDFHPIFPSDGYRSEIKRGLKQTYGAKEEKEFDPRLGKNRNVITFTKGY